MNQIIIHDYRTSHDSRSGLKALRLRPVAGHIL